MSQSSAKAIAWFDGNIEKFKSNYHDNRIDRGFMKVMRDRLPGGSVKRQLDILDIGAGTGIVSQHFASEGHRVVAVEPSAAMRAQATPSNYTLLDDSWPKLIVLQALGRTFDVIIEIAVRMFMDADDRAAGFVNSAAMLRPGGLYFVLVKHSGFDEARGAYPVTEDEVITLAHAANLDVIYNEIEPDLRGRSDAIWRGYIFMKKIVADRGGFEPPIRVDPV